jgi:hypothetical protein
MVPLKRHPHKFMNEERLAFGRRREYIHEPLYGTIDLPVLVKINSSDQ